MSSPTDSVPEPSPRANAAPAPALTTARRSTRRRQWLRRLGKAVDGDEANPRRDPERDPVSRRNRRLQVTGVDHLAPHRDLVNGSTPEVLDLLSVAAGTEVFVSGEDLDLARVR